MVLNSVKTKEETDHDQTKHNCNKYIHVASIHCTGGSTGNDGLPVINQSS